jgi:hypothetical protein
MHILTPKFNYRSPTVATLKNPIGKLHFIPGNKKYSKQMKNYFT